MREYAYTRICIRSALVMLFITINGHECAMSVNKISASNAHKIFHAGI